MGCFPSKPEEQHELVQPEGTKKPEQPPPHPPSTKPSHAPPKKAKTVSPFYDKLPEGAKKQSVRNVYDGDTLTLVDERRVRFLGIDTPELKEKQEFSQEAKDYTKSRCHKKDVWIVADGEDHYGRVLAHVFVREEGAAGFLCVNEGLVQQGLAYAYIPSKDKKTSNWDKLLTLQVQARTKKLGVWRSFKDVIVYATANGSAYHQKNCKHLAKSKNLDELKVSEAADRGLHPCRTCMTAGA